jgi:hypothetical protein
MNGTLPSSEVDSLTGLDPVTPTTAYHHLRPIAAHPNEVAARDVIPLKE